MSNSNPFDMSASIQDQPLQKTAIDNFMNGPLADEASPTPLSKAPVPAFDPDTHNVENAHEAIPFTVPEVVTKREVVIQDGYQVDPVTAQALARLPDTGDYKVGSYIINGDIFVFFDSFDANKSYNYFAKQMAYSYRFQIHMGDAGIEPWGSPSILTKADEPVSPLDPDRNGKKQIYRAIFRLTRSL